ncbi:hypothetical protein E2542_SST18891 [Spatholobus suberectus]|nr:hypothetical protein E2542_SST18891 [Spatholobus suberectus]
MADPASFIAGWLTPSFLFIFVNLVIGTIAIASRFGAPPKNQPQLVRSPSFLQRVRSFNLAHYTHYYQPECTQPQLVRTPSLLERVTSFNLTLHKHEPTHAETQPENPEPVRTPSLLERVTSFNLALHKHEPARAETQHIQPEPEAERPELVRSPSLLQRIRSTNLSRLYRSDSAHREDPDLSDPGLGSGKAEMRKSASEKAGSMESEWEEEVERRRPATMRDETTSWTEDEEVDAKADDFINRFKRQLRLQRIDSLLRCREMLRGGNWSEKRN